MKKRILVYSDWMIIDNKPVLLGILHSNKVKWSEDFSFEYSSDWLNNDSTRSIFLDPNLKLYSNIQLPDKSKKNFGIFTDSSPDSWGESLMKRRESILAKKENRQERHLLESDFLLGVYDKNRIGGLRFKTDEDGDFLSNDRDYSVPPDVSLKELEYASSQFEKQTISDEGKKKWTELLFAHGSSLGGARPKASIRQGKHLWIAKFPSRLDEIDTGAWEMVAHDLAEKSGITTPDANIKLLSKNGHTFLSKRFDRIGNFRIHFASAMALLGKDKAESKGSTSYLEIAKFIMRYGRDIKYDLKELWSRIVFNICVCNTDDHLRNHGFLLTPDGWILSPAYDITPSMYITGLSLNISDTSNDLDLGLALDVAKYFHLNNKQANAILHKIRSTIKSNWRRMANKYDIPKPEQERLSRIFDRVM